MILRNEEQRFGTSLSMYYFYYCVMSYEHFDHSYLLAEFPLDLLSSRGIASKVNISA
jgi:hypothetical protein